MQPKSGMKIRYPGKRQKLEEQGAPKEAFKVKREIGECPTQSSHSSCGLNRRMSCLSRFVHLSINHPRAHHLDKGLGCYHACKRDAYDIRDPFLPQPMWLGSWNLGWGRTEIKKGQTYRLHTTKLGSGGLL